MNKSRLGFFSSLQTCFWSITFDTVPPSKLSAPAGRPAGRSFALVLGNLCICMSFFQTRCYFLLFMKWALPSSGISLWPLYFFLLDSLAPALLLLLLLLILLLCEQAPIRWKRRDWTGASVTSTPPRRACTTKTFSSIPVTRGSRRGMPGRQNLRWCLGCFRQEWFRGSWWQCMFFYLRKGKKKIEPSRSTHEKHICAIADIFCAHCSLLI